MILELYSHLKGSQMELYPTLWISLLDLYGGMAYTLVMKFKYNFHLAKNHKLKKVLGMIEYYPKEYATPKYLLFMKKMLENGWIVKLYKAGVSKYVFIIKGQEIYKIRFSNHKPLYGRELAEDCDYYVGVSHSQVSTTDEIIKKIIQ